MSGPTTFVMPAAREELNAEEAKLRGDWRALAEMVEAQADALIEIAVRNGPRSAECGAPACGYCDPLDPVSAGVEDYCTAARALGVL